jgi:hypothetical protein
MIKEKNTTGKNEMGYLLSVYRVIVAIHSTDKRKKPPRFIY